AVCGDLLLVLGADVEGEVTPARALDARPLRAHLRRQAVLPEVRGFDDVVVDADRHGDLGHHEPFSESGSCCTPESKSPLLRMNVVERLRMRQPSGVRTYSSLYQPIRIACVVWSMNTKCCMPVAVSPSNSTTGMLPMNCPRGAASSSAGKRSSVYGVPNAL